MTIRLHDHLSAVSHLGEIRLHEMGGAGLVEPFSHNPAPLFISAADHQSGGPAFGKKPGHRFAKSLGAACDDSDFPCKLFLHFLILVEVH